MRVSGAGILAYRLEIVPDHYLRRSLRSVSMTVLAIGAAVCPPTPCWFSRKTETATRGASAGAKAMNDVVFTPGAPVSAVPVLPATATPGIWAAVPVPPVTTDSIMAVRALAVSAEIGREYTFGLCRTIVAP